MAEVDGFLSYKGDGCFRIKKRISKDLKMLEGEDYVLKFNEYGDFVAIRASRYWNGHKDFDGLWGKLRALDEFIVGKIRKDDEILQRIIFNGKE